jgi:trans-aconitate methyltransferase
VKNHGKLLKKIRRALKPEAVMRLGFAGEGNTPTLIRAIAQTMKAAPFAAAFAGFEWPWFMPSVKQYDRLLDEAGLEDTQVWMGPVKHRFSDEAELAGWLDQPCLAPFVGHLGEELGQAFRQAVVDKMIERTRQPDGSFVELFQRINVLARKREHQDNGIRVSGSGFRGSGATAAPFAAVRSWKRIGGACSRPVRAGGVLQRASQ